MNIRVWIVLSFVLLAVSACVVEPVGYRGGWHDDGRRVWR